MPSCCRRTFSFAAKHMSMHVGVLEFSCKPFDALSVGELYDVMQLRQEVFVVEQHCAYLDADGKDRRAWHLLAYDAESCLAAYARLLPPGVSYVDYPSIGRIVTARRWRRKGAGKQLMRQAIAWCERLFGLRPLKISAQTYLIDFYRGFGFEPIGMPYLEDGIPHTAMVREG